MSKSDKKTYPEMITACEACHGHGHEILKTLEYHKCRACGGSAIASKVKSFSYPDGAVITLEERGLRVKAHAEKRMSELSKEVPDEPDNISGGTNGMSDLDC